MEILFSQHALDVMAQRGILESWVFDTFETFSVKVSVSDVEEHYFKQIEEADFRCLKVVYNPKFMRVITVYFDRGMRKRGCK